MITEFGRTIMIRTPGTPRLTPLFEVIIHIIEKENRVDVYTHKLATKDLKYKLSVAFDGKSDEALIKEISDYLAGTDNLFV